MAVRKRLNFTCNEYRLVSGKTQEIVSALLRAVPSHVGNEAEEVIGYFLTDRAALDELLNAATQSLKPSQLLVPDVDDLVTRAMEELFGEKVDPSLLVKRALIGAESRLLLGVMLGRVGEPISLRELLIVNSFHTATARRIRELRNAHGGFDIVASGSGADAVYVLRSATPDLRTSADWWLKKNIREATLAPHDKLLAILSAYVGQPVPLDEIGEVLPEAVSKGKGRARGPQKALSRRIRELRDRGYVVRHTSAGYVLPETQPGDRMSTLSQSTRMAVLKRDKRRCTSCGWTPGADPGIRPRELQVHHSEPQRSMPANVHDESKLVTLCSWCHAGEEAELKKLIPRSAPNRMS